jgi:hypothetical protein
LSGVDKTSITIEAGEKEGTQKVTFKSTSGDIKKDDAVKSLGDEAKKYVVKEFAKQEEKKAA